MTAKQAVTVLGVPLAVFLAFLTYGGAGIWWGGNLDGRIDELEKHKAATREYGERLVRVETLIRDMEKRLGPMDRKLDRLLLGQSDRGGR